MSEKHLHIICLNVPYPVDYGGVFDLFYKLPALKNRGIKIHLHCFEYGRGEQPALNEYCEKVYYYKRLLGFSGFALTLPYIVSSRRNGDLLTRLLKDQHPILMEGVHCTHLLTDTRFSGRECFVRLHNVEHVYYKNLYKLSNNLFKKIYYFRESKLLLKYEKAIAAKATYFPVSIKDGDVYVKLGCKKLRYVPLFLPDWKIKSNDGTGTFCLYHGDLSVAENENAALWLLKEVFSVIDIPFVIAGKNPSASLCSVAEAKSNVCVVANPNENEMQDMIAKAQINILPAFNNTGIKLKLINALFNGRHCLVNNSTVAGTDLEDTCHIASNAESFISTIKELFHRPYTTDDVELRHRLLDSMFNNEINAEHLINNLWKQENY